MKIKDLISKLKVTVINEFNKELLGGNLEYKIYTDTSNAVVKEINQVLSFKDSLYNNILYVDKIGATDYLKDRIDKLKDSQLRQFNSFCNDNCIVHNMFESPEYHCHSDYGKRTIEFYINIKFLSYQADEI